MQGKKHKDNQKENENGIAPNANTNPTLRQPPSRH